MTDVHVHAYQPTFVINLVDRYGISISQRIMDLFPFNVDVFFPLSLPRLFSDLTEYRSNTTDVSQEAGIAYFSRAPEFTTDFLLGSMLPLCQCYRFLCLYVLSSVLLCALRFPHEKDVRSVFTSCCLQEGSGLYVICVCLLTVLNIFCLLFSFFVFLFISVPLTIFLQ